MWLAVFRVDLLMCGVSNAIFYVYPAALILLIAKNNPYFSCEPNILIIILIDRYFTGPLHNYSNCEILIQVTITQN